jgi:hypothetical protein
METPDCCGGWHTGRDFNRGSSGSDDCGDPMYSTARGCVRDVMSSDSDWGSAAIEHFYTSEMVDETETGYWTSQYGHASEVYHSVNAAVAKGAEIGKVGKVATDGCHLHFEIREQDHAFRNNATSYRNGSLNQVGDEHQNPVPFIEAHPAYHEVRWIDEESFATFGSWKTVSGIGDKDDLKWADSVDTNYARYYWTPPNTGTYIFYAFIPWNHRPLTGDQKEPDKLKSTSVRYMVVDDSTGAWQTGAVLNQSLYDDAWRRFGSGSLTGGTLYYIEVANASSVSGKKMVLDDFLIIRTSSTPKVYLPYVHKNSSGWATGIACQNLSQTDSAYLTLSFYPEANGTAVFTYSDPNPVEPGKSRGYFTPSHFPGLPSGFKGTAVVSANAEISCSTNTQKGSGTYLDHYRVASSAGFRNVDPSPRMFLPQVMKEFYGWSSTVAVQNASSSAVSVTISFKDRYGNSVPGASQTATIPARAGKFFNQSSNSGLPKGFLGAATVVSNDGTSSLVATTGFFNSGSSYSTAHFHSYNGVGSGAGKLLIPRVVRNYYGYNSGISIQNVGSSATPLQWESIRQILIKSTEHTSTPRVPLPRELLLRSICPTYPSSLRWTL